MLDSTKMNLFFTLKEREFDIKPGKLKMVKECSNFNWEEIEENIEVLLEALYDKLL